MAKITIYTTEACAHCTGAKMLLQKRGIDYDEVNLAKDPDARRRLAEQTGMITFPQILIDGRPLGGFDQLRAADRDGTLRATVSG